MESQSEQLPSGKMIGRQFDDHGSLLQEHHTYGTLVIGISMHFWEGKKIEELYFAKRRMISRRSYEKAREAYPDMPPADQKVEDVSGGLLGVLRREQRRRRAEAEQRLAASAESRLQRPASTNWFRVISDDKAHLVEFASRDWKLLCRERSLPTGPRWLSLFGFDGPPTSVGKIVSEGLIVGYETTGDREAMLEASRTLLPEVLAFEPTLRDPTWCNFSVRKKPKPRKAKPPGWTSLLPALIEFLESLSAPTVKIFNHHR